MRQANWHEVGGNARMFKGDEEEILRAHASPVPEAVFPRGSACGGQPDHASALYPKAIRGTARGEMMKPRRVQKGPVG
jgi:hypothetical protein